MVAWLPEQLPAQPKVLWEHKLSNQGLGGVAATDRFVVVSDRDAADAFDIFRCLAATDGHELWTLRYPARGKLDYGNSPRATPLIDRDVVYLQGALGDLHAVSLASGKVIWRKNLRQDFGVKLSDWGFCSSPLIANGRLIVNPGVKDGSLAALELGTGQVAWKTPGTPAAFGSFILANISGRQQLIGHDRESLGGWDPIGGRRLWRSAPPRGGDFSVPTPTQFGDKLLVASENNGTRVFAFDGEGLIAAKPLAHYLDLCPDISSPVVIGDRLFGVCEKLFCLDISKGLNAVWTASDDAFHDYTALLGGPDRVLLTTIHGELLLVDATGPEYRLIGRHQVFHDDSGVYSHPAIVGERFYLRGSTSIRCLDLADENQPRG